MSRALETRLRKLEGKTMTWEAQLARMTKEELYVELDRLMPAGIAELERSGDEALHAFAQSLKGRRAADLSGAENHRIMSILQVRLADG